MNRTGLEQSRLFTHPRTTIATGVALGFAYIAVVALLLWLAFVLVTYRA